jgi:hypothetical protein
LSRVILVGADAQEANLTEVDLKDADLRGARLPSADLSSADLDGADLGGADLRYATLYRAKNLDLSLFLTESPPRWQKLFLESQKYFLDPLSRDELADFNLSPEKLAKFRREASAP